MTSVLLIDLSSIAHPIYHVEIDPSATSTKTVERVRALASGHPHVGVCVEGGRSFRKDLDPTYKANRPEGDAALYHQIDVAIDILRADGFPILRAEGFEADDVIATAANRLLNCRQIHKTGEDEIEFVDSHTVVVSADKDLLQLVGPRVSVKSLKTGDVIDEATVEAKYGVRPDQMLDFLALVGDTSDNIKGCTDVGKVRAAGLLKKYGTLEDLYAAADKNEEEFTPALTASLREFRPRLEGVRSLIRLRTDAPIDIADVLKERVPLDVATFGDSNAYETASEDSPIGPNDAASVVRGYEVSGATGNPSEDTTERVVSGSAREVRRHGSNGADSQVSEALVKTHSGDLAPVEWERQLEPRNMAQMKLIAADLFASRLFSAYGHPAGIMATILSGRELGLPMMAALRTFHIIEGKATLAADLIRGLVLKSGVCDYFRCTERTNERATFVAKRKGDPEIALTFTVEDGKRAWTKGDKAWEGSGWAHNPADMCVARSGSKLARLVAPDVVSGLYAPEEME